MSETHGAQQPTQHGEAAGKSLFIPDPNPRITATEIALFLFSAIFVFGGFYVMGLAFSFPGLGFQMFGGGLLLDAFGLWIAFGLVPAWRAKQEKKNQQ